jgi:hypothetical protein
MRIAADEYEPMRAWFAAMAAELFPALSPETDPLRALDAMATKSPAKARAGLAMAIGDMVEMTASWPSEKVAAIDDRLRARGLASLTEIRICFSKAVARVVRRGRIEDDTEYHAVRNAAELSPGSEGELWPLLAAYERRAAGER